MVSFFKYSSAKYLNILYIIVFCIPTFLIAFQNCKIDEPLPEDIIESTEDNPPDINYEIGVIVQINPEDGEFIENQPLSINSDITFKLLNVDPTSDNYKWTIKRGFESIVTDVSTETDTYSMRFSELGSYNIFANSYEATESKTRASKRFVVGESCSLTDILEIELLPETSASFKVGESGYSTFGLKDSSNFSSINWKATLPSGQVIENEDGVDTLEVDLSSESNGLLVIEVSAISSDLSKSGCLAHRRKEVIVTSNIRPYFNPINFTDGRDSIAVVLENDIYMYEKPEMLFLQIEVLNADSCEYQINEESKIDFNCESELIEVLSNLGTDCINGVVTLFASKSQGEVYSQSYYHYCPADGNYCYFGPVTERPSLHVCSACPSGQYNSQTACDGANPTNSTCNSQSNGCYGWSCDSSYTQSGNSCVRSCPSNQYNSQTACDGVNPSNSTCQLQGNGCYGWSCDSSYTESGSSCVRTQGPSCGTSRNTCNPGTHNDGAVADTTSRYKWRCSHNGQNIDTCFSCKSGYQKSGNSCVRSCPSGQYTSSSGCNTANPSNSTCQSQGNGCYGWSCNSGYTQSGSSCARTQGPSCGTSRNTCNPGTHNDGAVADTTSTYKWRCSHNGQNIDTCFSCKSGYQKSGNSCVRTQGPSCGTSRNTCNPGTHNDEAVTDTTSTYKWRCSHNGQNIDTCFSCKSGYQKSGNSCVRTQGPSCGTSRNTCNPGTHNDGAVADTTSTYKWRCSHNGQNIDTCFSCKSGYQKSGNSCVRSCPSGQYTSSSGCNTANPGNSTCSSQSNGCYGWSCNSGYTQSGNSCTRSCPSGQYTSSSGCNTANPSNSTCKSRGNGCYSWSCDNGYKKSGNSCVRAISITHLRTPNRKGETVGNCQSDSRYNACIFFGYGQNDSTKNYGVNILDTINTFLENNSYKVLISDDKERATLVSGKWTRPYGSDPDFKTSQANIYHWLMYQKEWMELNAGTWYASNKDIEAKMEAVEGAFWLSSANKMAFPTKSTRANLFLTAFHEAGHANRYYAAGGKYIRSLNINPEFMDKP